MINELAITVLSENNSRRPDLISEHGLSLYIEADGRRLLFDTGASNVFLRNAEVLEKDISSVDAVILSHGHYDHTGGLAHLHGLDIYAHPDLFIPKYARRSFFHYEYIGNEYMREQYMRDNALRIHDVADTAELFPGCIMMTGFSKKGLSAGFWIKPFPARRIMKDQFDDELALVFQTVKGLVVITGCAHSGVLQIVEKAKKVCGSRKVHALLGGFHLSKLLLRKNRMVARALERAHISRIGISHCTGGKLLPLLKSEQVFAFNCGDVFTVKKGSA